MFVQHCREIRALVRGILSINTPEYEAFNVLIRKHLQSVATYRELLRAVYTLFQNLKALEEEDDEMIVL